MVDADADLDGVGGGDMVVPFVGEGEWVERGG